MTRLIKMFWKAKTNPSWISLADLLNICANACAKSCTLWRKRQLCIIPENKNLEQEGKLLQELKFCKICPFFLNVSFSDEWKFERIERCFFLKIRAKIARTISKFKPPLFPMISWLGNFKAIGRSKNFDNMMKKHAMASVVYRKPKYSAEAEVFHYLAFAKV